jgi:ketosteroid isomerase-like protein
MSEQGNIETTQRIFEIFQAGEHDELPDLIDGNVRAEFTARARQDLEPISLSLWFVFRFDAGRVVSIDEFDDEERARAAAGVLAHDSSAV